MVGPNRAPDRKCDDYARTTPIQRRTAAKTVFAKTCSLVRGVGVANPWSLSAPDRLGWFIGKVFEFFLKKKPT